MKTYIRSNHNKLAKLYAAGFTALVAGAFVYFLFGLTLVTVGMVAFLFCMMAISVFVPQMLENIGREAEENICHDIHNPNKILENIWEEEEDEDVISRLLGNR